jgi:hypothetical protein
MTVPGDAGPGRGVKAIVAAGITAPRRQIKSKGFYVRGTIK